MVEVEEQRLGRSVLSCRRDRAKAHARQRAGVSCGRPMHFSFPSGRKSAMETDPAQAALQLAQSSGHTRAKPRTLSTLRLSPGFLLLRSGGT